MTRITKSDKLKLIEALGYAIQWESSFADCVDESDPELAKTSRANVKDYKKLRDKLRVQTSTVEPPDPFASYEAITIPELIRRLPSNG